MEEHGHLSNEKLLGSIATTSEVVKVIDTDVDAAILNFGSDQHTDCADQLKLLGLDRWT